MTHILRRVNDNLRIYAEIMAAILRKVVSGNADLIAIPAKADIHALCIIDDSRRAWAPAFAGVAGNLNLSAFPQ